MAFTLTQNPVLVRNDPPVLMKVLRPHTSYTPFKNVASIKSFFGVLFLFCWPEPAFSLVAPTRLETPSSFIVLILTGTCLGLTALVFLTRKRLYKNHLRPLNIWYQDSLFAEAPVAMGVVHNRIVVAANNQLCELIGYSRDELTGVSSRLLYPDDREFSRVGAEYYDQLSMHNKGSIECWWQKEDGCRLQVLISFRSQDAKNPDSQVIFSVRDITGSKTLEQNLIKNEAYYRTLIELAVDGILIGNHDGVITEANHLICEMFKMSPETLIGRHITELPFSDASMQTTPFRFDLVQQGKVVIQEREFHRPDGTKIYVEMRTKMMPDGSYQSIYRDISVRKTMEQALRESEKKFALAFAASPDAININRLADGKYIAVNKGFTEISGYTWEEVENKTTLELDLWHDRSDRERFINSLTTKGFCKNLEAVFKRKDGSLGTGLVSARIMKIDDIPHTLSITRDVSQERQDAADLKRLQVAIDQAGEVVVITDPLGNIQYANPAFEQVTGYSLDEVYLKNPRLLKSEEHDKQFYQSLWQTISAGKRWNGRMVNRKKDGSLYTEEAAISPVFNAQGEIVNYVAIKRDITDQLGLEAQYQQAQKMESIGRLTGGVAHDFNNILAVIIGYSEMAMAKIDRGNPLYHDLDKILEAAHRSAEIVQQLLAFARKQSIAPQMIHLNQRVESLLTMLRRLIGESVELHWLPSDHLGKILVDPAQVDQILANLCINARDAMESTGTIWLRTSQVHLDQKFCSHYPDASEGMHVLLEVIDNGCGMEKEVMQMIFDPFFTTKGVAGTGLGLATVYGIVTQNKGIITVDSQPGKGTTFSVYLPVAEEVQFTEAIDEEIRETIMGQGEWILLVEDDPAILTLASTMLDTLNYRVLSAASPQEALHKLASHPHHISLLLTDVIMPGMNGAQLAEHLVRQHPRLRVLYISGYTADIIGKHGVLNEDIPFVQKPFELATLSAKIHQVLSSEEEALRDQTGCVCTE